VATAPNLLALLAVLGNAGEPRHTPFAKNHDYSRDNLRANGEPKRITGNQIDDVLPVVAEQITEHYIRQNPQRSIEVVQNHKLAQRAICPQFPKRTQ